MMLSIPERFKAALDDAGYAIVAYVGGVEPVGLRVMDKGCVAVYIRHYAAFAEEVDDGYRP